MNKNKILKALIIVVAIVAMLIFFQEKIVIYSNTFPFGMGSIRIKIYNNGDKLEL